MVHVLTESKEYDIVYSIDCTEEIFDIEQVNRCLNIDFNLNLTEEIINYTR